MTKIRIIGDLHLSEDTPEILSAFYLFIDACINEQVDELYILGDFFDVWVGDDVSNAIAGEVSDKLAYAHQNGMLVFFQHGNRDFLLGHQFAQQAKMHILDEIYDLPSLGVVLMHGDLLCQSDRQYQFYRSIVQSRFGKWTIQKIPKKYRERLGERARQHSQTRNASLAQNIMDVTPEAVANILDMKNRKILVHGHTHLPAVHETEQGQRIVVGAWEHDIFEEGVMVCELEGARCQLICWKP